MGNGHGGICKSRLCTCVWGAAELFCFPPADREGQAEARKGPHWGKKSQIQWEAPSPEPFCTQRSQGQAGCSGCRGKHFCPSPIHQPGWAKKQLRFGAEGFLIRQQRVTESSYHNSLSLQTGDRGWSPATCAGLYFPGPPHAHPPGSRPSPCARAPKAIGRGRAGGHGR